MVFVKVLSLSVGAGSSNDTYWAPERDVNVKAILVTERSSQALDNVFCKITKADLPLTREAVPMSIFNVPYAQAPPFTVVLEKGVKLSFYVTNNLTSDIQVDIIIFYE